MQPDPNRLLPKSHKDGTEFRDSAVHSAYESVRNAVILHPKMPATELADLLIAESDREVSRSLSEILQRRFYAHRIRLERRSLTATNQPTLPGFDSLPADLLQASYSAVRKYYWTLVRDRNRSNERRKQNDAKIKQAKALMVLMREHARNEKGITVKEVLFPEAFE